MSVASRAFVGSRPQARISVAPSRSRSVRVMAGIAEGATVRVKTSVKVYHVPKTAGAETELEGKEGVVTADVSEFKGQETSATLAIRVQFTEPAKFVAHLDESELEVVS